jgi:Kef-type K+ transport system membrane component KefB
MEHGSLLFSIFAAFAAAKVAAELFERIGQPAVVGELLAGVAVGPFALNWVQLDGANGETMLLLAELGVIVLLFQAGLENEPSELRAVGRSATGVALLGILLPFGAGLGAALALGKNGTESSFIATALVATSVGVTARVLRDLGRMARAESKIILGAAVIDDVLGLIILTIVVGLNAGSLNTGQIVVLIVEALLFVGALFVIAPRVMSRISFVLEKPKIPRAPFALAIIVLLGLSYAAEEIGLAAIVGAFLAGTILSESREHFALEEQVAPVSDFLTPFFFVVTGAQIDPNVFARASVLGLAAVITVIAVAGKVFGGILGARDLDRRGRLIVGFGMVPRGEVGIIVAGLALSTGALSDDVFGAILAMVVVTTIAAPPIVQRLFAPERA